MGDGTRAVRAMEPWGGRLIGNVYPPDVGLWPKQAGLPIPLNYEDCATVIRALRGNNCLAHEALHEQSRSDPNPNPNPNPNRPLH